MIRDTYENLPSTHNGIDILDFGKEQPKKVIKVGPTITAAELQDVIDDAQSGTLISLSAGNYFFDQTISLERDGIYVVGAGSDDTTIRVRSDLGQEAFQIGSSARSRSQSMSEGALAGETTLRMTSGHDYEAGDYLMLSRASTGQFFDSVGDESWRKTDVPVRTSLVRIEKVDRNMITLESGLHFDFPAGESEVRKMRMVEDVRLGNFTIDYGFGQANPSDFSNNLGLYNRDAVVAVDNAADLIISDIVAHDIPSNGISVSSSRSITVDGVEFAGTHNKGSGGNGYSVWIGDVYDSSFSNIRDEDMRHSVVFNSWTSAAGNEVHVRFTDRDINFHGGRDHSNVVMIDQSIRDANSDVAHPTLYTNVDGAAWGTATDPDANVARFGKVIGTKTSDSVQGYDGGSWLEGRGGNDSLEGGAGNDVLAGGSGNDVLAGGAGEDIAAFIGRLDQFEISRSNGTLIVRDKTRAEGTDEVSGVEWLVFDDGALRTSDMNIMTTGAVDDVYQGYAQTEYRAQILRAADWQEDPVEPTDSMPVAAPEPDNRAPVAKNDAAAVDEDTSEAIDVMANDADPDGDALTLLIAAGANNGSLQIRDGRIVYTPDAGFVGSDDFTYRVTDGGGLSDKANVTVTVREVPAEAVPGPGRESPTPDFTAPFDTSGDAFNFGDVTLYGFGVDGSAKAVGVSNGKIGVAGAGSSNDIDYRRDSAEKSEKIGMDLGSAVQEIEVTLAGLGERNAAKEAGVLTTYAADGSALSEYLLIGGTSFDIDTDAPVRYATLEASPWVTNGTAPASEPDFSLRSVEVDYIL